MVEMKPHRSGSPRRDHLRGPLRSLRWVHPPNSDTALESIRKDSAELGTVTEIDGKSLVVAPDFNGMALDIVAQSPRGHLRRQILGGEARTTGRGMLVGIPYVAAGPKAGELVKPMPASKVHRTV